MRREAAKPPTLPTLLGWKLASISMYYAAAQLLADEDQAAEAVLRPAVEALQGMGEAMREP